MLQLNFKQVHFVDYNKGHFLTQLLAIRCMFCRREYATIYAATRRIQGGIC